MTRQERAKQFMPFDAMKGLSEALRERERRHETVPKSDLLEDAREELENNIVSAKVGDRVRIAGFFCGFEEEAEGTVTKIDTENKYVEIEKEQDGAGYEDHRIRFDFDDIYRIER